MKSPLSLLAGLATRRAAGGNSVAPHFLASSDGVMEVCRGERVRPRLAALALAGLLLGQTLVPCGVLLSSVHAAESRVAGQSGAKTSGAKMPAWVARGAGLEPREANLRLAQLATAGKGGNEAEQSRE